MSNMDILWRNSLHYASLMLLNSFTAYDQADCMAMESISQRLYFSHTTLFIVVDLSKPEEMWYTLENLLAAARSRIETIIGEMKRDHPNIRDTLKKQAWERFGENTEVRQKKKDDNFILVLVLCLLRSSDLPHLFEKCTHQPSPEIIKLFTCS